MSCRYGGVTCSCNDYVVSSSWSCGVCPSTKPTSNDRCSANALFECRYGSDNCVCDGFSWTCSTPVCEAPRSTEYPSNCVWPAIHTCEFPAQDQICSCGDANSGIICSCPAAMPVEDSLCLGPVTPGCSYGDRVCDCVSGRWFCGACPVNPPADGASCGYQTNCSYPTAFCYCDGTTWSCS